ncbi:MAG: flagellar export chaperone FlgN [Planctomycetota bacterium]|jgi:hypothetical protein
MKTTAVGIEDKVDELLAVLDTDVRHIQESLSRLNELRSLVIKRDDEALGKLLERIRGDSDGYTANGARRNSIRSELATALGCSLEQVTLASLETALPKEKIDQVKQTRARLKSLTEELKKEHASTALLLSECARFNSLLLNSILGLGQTGVLTYGSDGAAKRQAHRVFVNLQF